MKTVSNAMIAKQLVDDGITAVNASMFDVDLTYFFLREEAGSVTPDNVDSIKLSAKRIYAVLDMLPKGLK